MATAAVADIKAISETEGQPSAIDVVEDTQHDNAKTRMYLLSALALDPKKALDELTALVKQAGSNVLKAEDLGVKRLAFTINKHRQLSLVSVFFNADNSILQALNIELKHAETIERYLLSSWRAGLDEPKRRPSTALGMTLDPAKSRQSERAKKEEEKNV